MPSSSSNTPVDAVSVLRGVALELQKVTTDVIASQAEFFSDFVGIDTNESELAVFYAAIAAAIGNQFIPGPPAERRYYTERFLNSYLSAVAKALELEQPDLSRIYVERAPIYQSLLDNFFAQPSSGTADQLASVLYHHVFEPGAEPAKAIGSSLAGWIYKLATDAKAQLHN